MTIMNRTRKKNLLLMSVLIAFIALAGCIKEDEKTEGKDSYVNPPFEKLDPEFTTFSIDNQTPDTLTLESGTRLFIPQNAFTDSSGIAATGKVKVRYREFHDALDIFLAGIPMEFDTGDRRRHLQTAGMFEIRADKDGEPMKLAEGKSIGVDLASRKAGKQYNFFGFDEETGEWNFMGYPESRENPQYQKTKEKIEKLKDTRKIPMDSTHFIFDYRGALDVYKYKLDKDAQNQDLKARVKKYGLEWLNVDNRNMINFQGNRYVASFMVWQKLEGNPFPEWLREKSYFSTDMKKLYGNVYSLEISYSDKHNYTAKVKCIMPLRSLLAFSPEYWENNYEEAMQEAKKEEKRLRTQAKVFRSFEINNLGVNNFDRLYKRSSAVEVNAEFTVAESYDNEAYELDRVFCLPGNNETVIKLNPRNWDKIWLDAEDENYRLITVLPDNKIGMYPLDKYRSLNFDSLRKAKNPTVNFTMEPVGEEIKSRKQLKNLLGF